jgi:UDP-glucoronosyl and UDP-glucosyl transferase
LIRVLLANEFGNGRGHIVTLKSAAEALGNAFAFDAALCRLDHQAELQSCCDNVFRGAGLHYHNVRRHGAEAVITATWGEYLGDLGFARVDFIKEHILWWRALIDSGGYDLIIAECAPSALLAARSLGIPAVAIGPGHSVPPEDLKTFPLLMPENNQRLYDENELAGIVNTIMEPFGLPTLQVFPEIYACTDRIVRTVPLLDPYKGQRPKPYVPPVVDISEVQAGGGDEVFAYFSDVAEQPASLNQALCDLGLPVRAFIPGIDPQQAQQLSAHGVHLEPSAVSVNDIIKRSRVLVHYGMHGLTCLGMVAGLPQVMLPQQGEQLSNGRRVAECGAARVVMPKDWSVENIQNTIHEVYADKNMADAAKALGQEMRPILAVDARLAIRERLRPIITDIFRKKGLV